MTSIAELSNDTSFESVIAATQQLLRSIETGAQTAESIQSDLIHLLNLKQGPRGFFASFLTDPGAVADHPPDSVMAALSAVPDVTADFLVKNLAMSTAMVVFHTRNDDPESAAGSQQVQQRSQHLIQQLNINQISDALSWMILSLLQSEKYSDFLDRWKYDDEQRAAIRDRMIEAAKYRCIMLEE